VEKFQDTTGIRRVEGEERIMEIARLLSGERIIPEAVANAKALLG
jgi:DNA repair ATPase RecN